MKKKMLTLVVVAILFIAACDTGTQKSSGTDYSYTNDSLAYKFYIENQDQPKPEQGKILTVQMTYGTDDTILYNTDMLPDKMMKIPLNEPEYPGDFYSALGMMHIGDSASFIMEADSFFLKTARMPSIPPYAKDIEDLVFHVKLVKAQTEDEMREEYEAKMQDMKMQEDIDIEAYLDENDINAAPTASGLYFIEEKEGTGPRPDKGDKVKVHYTGRLLDGTKFDSSRDRGTPFEFTLGQGQVIQGWDQGIAMMREGGKAQLLIPSRLGYGERGAGRGQIPPYAPLLFDVELIEVIEQ